MGLFAPLSFGAPWILAALVGLPVAVVAAAESRRPSPRRILFPPLRLLLGLKDEEQTPAAHALVAAAAAPAGGRHF